MGRVALLVWLAAASPAFAKPIDCAQVATDGVERAICASPQLLALDATISRRYDEMLPGCGPQAHRLLVAGQQFWLRERNDCSNTPGRAEATREQCLANRLQARADFLAHARQCDVAQLVVRYRFVDPWYLREHGAVYLDSPVSVAGVLKPRACETRQAGSTRASLYDVRHPAARIEVVLKSLPEEQRRFLCGGDIFSNWDGTVTHRGRDIVLAVDDILGVPLP
jgi:uncharacterized protein